MANPKKSALGRGLSALLEHEETDITQSAGISGASVGSTTEISISQIEANPFQPRTRFESNALEELAESIRLHGVIQPVTVRKVGNDKYQLISGERRFSSLTTRGIGFHSCLCSGSERSSNARVGVGGEHSARRPQSD